MEHGLDQHQLVENHVRKYIKRGGRREGGKEGRERESEGRRERGFHVAYEILIGPSSHASMLLLVRSSLLIYMHIG